MSGLHQKCLLSIVLLVSVLIGCNRIDQSRTSQTADSPLKVTLKVAAAANLKFAFEEIEKTFETQHPNIDLKVTYGSSGKFFAQLSQQAPFDLFLSADTLFPDQLVNQGFARANSRFVYAMGRLALWVPNDSMIDIDELGMRSLVAPTVRKIAIANPRLAPYGRAAESAMISAGIYDEVKDRLVLGENISQTAQFVESGAADVGILALSLALAPELKEKGGTGKFPLRRIHPSNKRRSFFPGLNNRKRPKRFACFLQARTDAAYSMSLAIE